MLTRASQAPIRGADLEKLREKLQLSVADMCWLTGLSPNRWFETVNKKKDDIVADEALDLLVRVLRTRPELSPLPPEPDLVELYHALEEDLTKKDFGILFGRNSSSGYAWVERGDAPNPIVRRLAMIFDGWLQGSEKHGRRSIEDWKNVVREAAKARGLKEDVFEMGKWPTVGNKD